MIKSLVKRLLRVNANKNKVGFIKNKRMNNKMQNIMLQNGKIWSKLIDCNQAVTSLHDVEFKVFSQWGDDGIIQYLINFLDINNKVFIEFGVQDYEESNTRFLLMNNNWSGLILDGSENNISKVKNSELFWKYDLVAKSTFVTAENINQTIENEGFKGEVGLLHIDIDGNDYWILNALNIVQPIIMVVEYNSIFGYNKALTIPYKPDFDRTTEHHSNLYAGASLLALCDLAEERGYIFIGSNSAGNNAYFVKREYAKNLKPLTAKEGYVESKFRESRNPNGALNFLRAEERLEYIKGLPIYNTRSKTIESL